MLTLDLERALNDVPYICINEYQRKCEETDLGNKGGRALLNPDWSYYVFGLGEETGELLGKIKKLFRDYDGDSNNPDFRRYITLEMGDIMWYMARLATKLDIELSDVLKMNLEKLFSRKERGKIKGSGDSR